MNEYAVLFTECCAFFSLLSTFIFFSTLFCVSSLTCPVHSAHHCSYLVSRITNDEQEFGFRVIIVFRCGKIRINVKGKGNVKGEAKNKFLCERQANATTQKYGIDDCDLRLLCHGCELQANAKGKIILAYEVYDNS